ncbi:MAG: DNA polymerase, partial [Elusimicrobiales bacterium]
MKYNVFTYDFNDFEDDWKNVIVYDIETVDTIEQLERIKEEKTFDFLDVKKAKHVAFAIRKDKYLERMNPITNKLLSKMEDEGKIEKRTYKDWIIYVLMNTNAQEIVEILWKLSSNLRMHLVAHNGKKFDFAIFRQFEGTFDYKIRIYKNNPFLVKAKKKKKIFVRLIDTFDITKASLENSLKQFRIDITKETKKDLKEYLIRDVELLIELTEALETANINYTLTRTAKRFYVDVAKTLDIKTIKTFLPDGFEPSYIGGRVEVFKAIAKDVKYYDFNSMYPFVMTNFRYPLLKPKENGEHHVGIYKGFRTAKESFYGFIDAMRLLVLEALRTDARKLKSIMDYKETYFYVKFRIKGINENFKEFEDVILRYFPYSFLRKGRRLYTLDTNAEYFAEGYEIIFLTLFDFEVLELYYVDSDYLVFKDAIKNLYEERKKAKEEGDVSKDARLKGVLVNLYGLFGLRYEKTIEEKFAKEQLQDVLELTEGFTTNDIERIIDFEPISKITLSKNQKKIIITITGEEVSLRKTEKLFTKKQSIPVFATATTSHGRFWLLSNIYYIVLNKQGEVYYCDTDSVFTNVDLPSNKDLGNLKHEATIEKAYFLAPKTYIYIKDGEVVIKAKGTGNAFVREMVVQTLKTDFQVIEKKALTEERKTYKAVGSDGWLYYKDEEVDYFETYKDVILQALNEILDENVRNQLLKLLEEAEEGEEDEAEIEAEEGEEVEGEEDEEA